MRRFVSILAILMVITACDIEHVRVERIFSLSDSERLVSDLKGLWEKYHEHATEQATATSVPQEEWPGSVKRYQPNSISVTSDGVWVIVYDSPVETAGIFVVFNPQFTPKSKPDSSFERLDGPCYWFYTSD